jgi:glycosyltransferase involved in cell wall biosynthesis
MIKKILYISRLDPRDLKSWSGLNYFILRCLEKKKFKITVIGKLSNRIRLFYIPKRYFFSKFNIKFSIDRPISVAKDFACQINKKIKNLKYDAIVTSDSNTISFLNTKKPIFLWTDLTFSTYYKHYFSNLKIHQDTLSHGNFCQKRALKNSYKIILTSKWAVNEAVKKYSIPKKSFHVLPFGANLIYPPKKTFVIKNILKKKFDICNLITIGVDWNRKGIEKSINLTKLMNEKGQKTKLYIIGAKKPNNLRSTEDIIFINFLNKNSIKDNKIFSEYLINSHFHILFTKAEGCGVVFAEASAFGVFSITHDLGGIPGMVSNGINGRRFNPQNDDLDKISNYIINIFNDKKKFIKKSLLSRNEYDKKLNWDVIGDKLIKIINS